MIKLWLSVWLLPIFGAFFAAGAPPLTGDAGDAGAIDDVGADDAGADDGAAVDDVADDAAVIDDAADDDPPPPEKVDTHEEPELAEFKGTTAARLRKLETRSPEIAAAFKRDPKLKEEVAAVFRREAALREVFPTVAEARQFREKFPNGLADVQSLEEEVQQLEALDKDFYSKDDAGNYAGHTQLLNNMFTEDRAAAVSLFKTLPKEWARLDPESYNDVMGQIVGATIAKAGVLDHVQDLYDAAKEAKNDGLVKGLGQLLGWAQGFLKEKPKPTAEQEALTRDRQAFDKQKTERAKEEGQRFHQSFVGESKKLQTGVIRTHPAVKKLLENKSIPDAKKAEIIEQVRKNTESFLGKSPSFMKKLRPAYDSRNLQSVLDLQKAAWSQQWLLNRMVRSVFAKEIPQLVSNNREVTRRRAGASPTRTPDKTGGKGTPNGPHQVGGVWYKADGSRFSSTEILSGKHLS